PAPAQADNVRDKQWHLNELRVRTAWHESTGKGVVVAVVDSGVDATHPDLKGQVLPGIDLVDKGGDGRTDDVGHGTTTAALIAGRHDKAGVVGLAYDTKILPVRVLDGKNRYEDAKTVADGVRWAVDHGAQVVNLSLGGATESSDLAGAIQYAYDHDVVVVACGGNVGVEDTDQIWYPAREPGVVAVTGLGRDGQFWKKSLYGPESVVSAPAEKLVGAKPGGYWRVQGTSFAAPLVSATAALIRSYWPDMTAPNVVNRLIRTARDLGPEGRDDKYGFGVVDPVRALENPVTSVKSNPLDLTPPSRSPSARWSSSPGPKAIAEQEQTYSLGWWWLVIWGCVGAGGGAGAIAVIAARRRGKNPFIGG
ncbi:MAG: type VII secretion-associated serine protease mycosin, partial [Micromonosporaceae bacterium]